MRLKNYLSARVKSINLGIAKRITHAEEADAKRPNSNARGYDAAWRRASLAYLRRHPLCVHCQREGRTTAATLVDHIIPHRWHDAQTPAEKERATKLKWDSKGNWQSLCATHHSRKTNKFDGGLGNARKTD